jgi:hypothetical protein
VLIPQYGYCAKAYDVSERIEAPERAPQVLIQQLREKISLRPNTLTGAQIGQSVCKHFQR